MSKVDLMSIAKTINGIQQLKYLAEGGQKTVFRGQHAKYGGIVLKIITKPNERINREIAILQENRFRNVPILYESGTIEIDGTKGIFLIEQFIEGENLRNLINREKRIDIQISLELAFNLLETIVQLEDKRLVHRDIKPENIIFDGNKFWLLDFGIARNLDLTSITATEQHFGPHTLGYAAPEQFRNMKAQVDSRADLFSIGTVLYESITGNQPFINGATGHLDVIKRTESFDPEIIEIEGDSNKMFAQFINVLMSKYPSRRPQKARLAMKWFLEIRPNIKVGD